MPRPSEITHITTSRLPCLFLIILSVLKDILSTGVGLRHHSMTGPRSIPSPLMSDIRGSRACACPGPSFPTRLSGSQAQTGCRRVRACHVDQSATGLDAINRDRPRSDFQPASQLNSFREHGEHGGSFTARCPSEPECPKGKTPSASLTSVQTSEYHHDNNTY